VPGKTRGPTGGRDLTFAGVLEHTIRRIPDARRATILP